MTTRRSGMAIWPLVAVGLAASCTGPTEAEFACTLIGCNDQLQVVLEQLPPAPFRVEASTGAGAKYVFSCEEGMQCGEAINFPFFVPDHVTIDLVVGEEAYRFQFTPQYEEHRPNGPRCPPTCRLGIVQIPVADLMAGELRDLSLSFAIEGPGSCPR